MSLLNLMQRAGVLEVLSVNTESGDEASWEIEIRDPAILSESDIGVWDLIFKLRDAEQGTARAELDIFVRLMTSPDEHCIIRDVRSEEHTSELQSLMRNSYAVFCLKKQK